MALATTCPACKTSFKVNPDQLKLRKGLVRCGKCEHVFSGVDFLRYVRENRKPEVDKKTINVAPEPQDTGAEAEADALSPDTETVSEDLNTAFFLPETQMDDSPAQQSDVVTAATPAQTSTPEQPASEIKPDTGIAESVGNAPTRKQSRSKSSRRNSRRRKRRRATDRDPNAPTPGIAAIEERRETGRRRADGSTPQNARPEPPQITGNAQLATTHAAKPAPGSEQAKQDKFDRQFGEAIEANQGVSDDTSINDAGADTETGAQEFPDTLQANLPEAWQTTAIWPTFEEDMLAGDLPADLPSEVGERNYRGAARRPNEKLHDAKPPENQGEAVVEPVQILGAAAQSGSNEDEFVGKTESNEQGSPDSLDTADTSDAESPFDSQLHAEAASDLTEHKANERSEEDAIDFFGQTSKPVFDFDLPPRGVWLAAAGLSLLLCFQLAIGARDTLAAMFPPAKPVLQAIASPLGLTVGLPVDPESITIESFDLISTGQSDYVMNMLMRNRAGTSLRWPAIELTLTDSTGGILVRKALMPADYLKDDGIVAKGIDANVEHIVKLQFNTDGINPSGYSAILFYY